MKQKSIANQKRKRAVAKRIAVLAIAAVSCFSTAFLPGIQPDTKVSAFTWTNRDPDIYEYEIAEVGGKRNSVELTPGKWYTSNNGNYVLVFQHDGNLVIYHRYFAKVAYIYGDYLSDPVWSSESEGKDGKKCVMQRDGNLVIYNDKGKAIWATNSSYGCDGDYYLMLTNDGELRVKERPKNSWYPKLTRFSSYWFTCGIWG